MSNMNPIRLYMLMIRLNILPISLSIHWLLHYKILKYEDVVITLLQIHELRLRISYHWWFRWWLLMAMRDKRIIAAYSDAVFGFLSASPCYVIVLMPPFGSYVYVASYVLSDFWKVNLSSELVFGVSDWLLQHNYRQNPGVSFTTMDWRSRDTAVSCTSTYDCCQTHNQA